jgi:hypothetical protein
LLVEGKLIAPWAAEPRIACERARADLRGRELVIEMKQITMISQEGKLPALYRRACRILGNAVDAEERFRMLF